MRAVRCSEFNSKLSVEEVPPPAMIERGVRIAVAAAGVNFADSLMVAGQYQVKPPLPFTPGLEVAGTVIEADPSVSGLARGDRVMGVAEWGAFAEEAVIPATSVYRIPDSMDFNVAAGFPVAYGTSYGAFEWRARLKRGETVLVLGAAGGVGLAAVEVAKAIGATVIAMAGSAEKLALAKSHGADHAVDYGTENIRDRLRELTKSRGVDVVLDPVGGDAFDACLRSIAFEGRLIVVGFAAGKIQQVPANIVLVRNCDVIGFYWGAYLQKDPEKIRSSYVQLFRWFEEGRLRPHVAQAVPLEQAGGALDLLRSRKATGKIVVITGRQ